MGGLHSNDNDDDDRDVHIVLDQQTWVVYIVMMTMMMTGCPHCTRPTDLGGLHSDDDDDDEGGVHIVLDQQTWVVYIVMMMMIMMTEVSILY